MEKEQLRKVLQRALALLGEGETVSFSRAVQESLLARATRRKRTLAEIRGVCRRLMREVPGLAEHPVRLLGRRDCAALLARARTPRQRLKMRTILHGVFEYCRRQEWCAANPVAYLSSPVLQEQEIRPLSWHELQCLTRQARSEEHRCCMPALGLMLWAGVRPAEVVRLCWQDINWEESVISLRPAHSKTGGCRHIQLHAVLRAWLGEHGPVQGAICPANWQRRWRRLRESAGLSPWRQDVLRHTFASYHAKQFHDFARLQEEMGHRSAALLRTRYLSMHGLTAAMAARFWTPGGL